MMINEVKFDNEPEMSVDHGLHGCPEDGNWWVRLMTWRECKCGHRMTWTSKAWGPVAGPVLEGVKVGSGGGAVTLKQRRTELVRGYLAPRTQIGDGGEKRPKDRVKTGKTLRKTLISLKIPKRHKH
jgi:hypothetical protein